MKEENNKKNNGLESGRVFKLEDLAGYQKGAVVSRTLIDKTIGTITIFSFDEGQGLSEHTAPFDALVNVIDGEAEITISGERQIVKEDEIILMPAHEPHSLRALTRFKMLLIMIKG
ncbi:MAG: cupin domain-containing protein [Candidatus Krumholzibacteriota bacterium]|nr:cupin domain-containing protein [Candidatus Krumholzibacteriota bacterium]